MDKSSGTEEEQRLEHGMSEQVEHSSHVTYSVMELRTSHTKRNHHKRNLRNGGERENALDVDLRAGNHRGIESGQRAYHSDNLKRSDLHEIEREQTGHKIYTGYHHCSCVDKS